MVAANAFVGGPAKSVRIRIFAYPPRGELNPSHLFSLRADPGELADLIEQRPEMAAELLAILDGEVYRAATLKAWEEWRRHNFAQFQRPARRGLYLDNSYTLKENPSSDCHEIINNALTGWTGEDEARAADWIRQG